MKDLTFRELTAIVDALGAVSRPWEPDSCYAKWAEDCFDTLPKTYEEGKHGSQEEMIDRLLAIAEYASATARHLLQRGVE